MFCVNFPSWIPPFVVLIVVLLVASAQARSPVLGGEPPPELGLKSTEFPPAHADLQPVHPPHTREPAEASDRGAEASARGAEVPAGGAEVPAGGAEVPAGGAEVPAGGAEVSAGGAEASARGAETPAGDADGVAAQTEATSASRFEVSGAPGYGLTFQVGDTFSLNLRSRIQLRYQTSISPENDAGEREVEQLINIGTARLWFSGNLFVPHLTYMLQLALAGRDFRDGAVSPIYDAYLDWKIHRNFNVRAGQFFVPFDRLRTVREWALQLADRPRPVLEFTLDRDVGVSFYSERFLGDRSPIAWSVGVFGGGGTNLTQGREPGALIVGRLELRPLGPIDDDKEGDLERRRRPGLALGSAFASNLNSNRLRSTTGPTFQGGTTDFLHTAADLVFKWWGFALQAEYLWKRASTDAIVSTSQDGVPLTEYTRSGQGWIVQASYTFDPPFEVVGRLSRMDARAGTDPQLIAEVDSRGQEIAAGLNYYFNDHRMKLQGDWVARMPHDFDLERADHVVHLQLDVTF